MSSVLDGGRLKGTLSCFSYLKGELRGHFILFSPLEGLVLLFELLEAQRKWHFIMFSLLERHLGGLSLFSY